ncbi:MAG: hypothetical protein M1824_003076 [Vezdaea acicularis]|nr:MAG: hypothetical protein M1824_003076 [Vezdaea acicularis]
MAPSSSRRARDPDNPPAAAAAAAATTDSPAVVPRGDLAHHHHLTRPGLQQRRSSSSIPSRISARGPVVVVSSSRPHSPAARPADTPSSWLEADELDGEWDEETDADESKRHHLHHQQHRRSMRDKSSLPTTSSIKRPLIDLVRNEWRTDAPDLVDDEQEWPTMLFSARFRRYVLVYAVLLLTCYSSWRFYLRPRWDEQRVLSQSLDDRTLMRQGWFGINSRPDFLKMIQLKTLDQGYVPQVGVEWSDSSKKERNGRLVIVGDVHGCREEPADRLILPPPVDKLLDKLTFNPKYDHLILTGDAIAKGPDSPGVIDLLIRTNASCVRGNHEDRVLLAHRDLNTPHIALPGPEEDLDTPADDLDEESFNKGDYKARAVAKSLQEHHVRYLSACPVILRVGQVGGLGEVVVVHAGMIPGVAYEKQDPFGVMNMRTVDLETHVPSSSHEGTPWWKLWNHHQARLPPTERVSVVYGHNSKAGFVNKPYTKGLDTGCVRGGKLTAMVIEGGRKRESVSYVSVKCKGGRERKMEAKAKAKAEKDMEMEGKAEQEGERRKEVKP